ncbi:MAG: amidohydrolase family protein, partial [Giesbergeria sp.]|nr:amidohydrolase family protein [Giesbergeria sp.]
VCASNGGAVAAALAAIAEGVAGSLSSGLHHAARGRGAGFCTFNGLALGVRAARAAGEPVLMGAPNVVRGGSHSGNVAAADLARAGLLDILSSDYVPGSLLSAVMRLVDEGILSMPQAVATVTRNPAKAAGMADRGALAPGLRADLVQVHMADLPDGTRQAVVRGVWREGQRVL